MMCQECDAEVADLHADPRSPPLDTDPCLCLECAMVMLDQEIENKRDELSSLRLDLAQLVRLNGKEL